MFDNSGKNFWEYKKKVKIARYIETAKNLLSRYGNVNVNDIPPAEFEVPGLISEKLKSFCFLQQKKSREAS